MKQMKTLILCLILVIFCGVTVALSSMDEESDTGTSGPAEGNAYLKVPVGEIQLTAPDDIGTRKSPVDFPHSKHFTYTCYTCHHTWEGDENLQSCSASGCHDQVERPKPSDGTQPTPEEEITYFKQAYHQLCITCHKEIQQQNVALELSLKQIKGKLPNVGPTSCVGCHPPDEE